MKSSHLTRRRLCWGDWQPRYEASTRSIIMQQWDRREMLAAGGLGLAQAIAAEPVAGVEDRFTSIRISGVRGFRVGTKAYVKIETNHEDHRLGRDHRPRAERRRRPGRVAVRAARRREPDAHRAPVAEDLPLAPRHARRAVHDAHPVGHRHGPVGHHRQAVGRAGLSPARRADARQDPHVSHAQGPQARHRRPASLLRQPARHRAAWSSMVEQTPQDASAPTAPSCSTPTAPCRRRC